jgi:putative ABC transport system permease protein
MREHPESSRPWRLVRLLLPKRFRDRHATALFEAHRARAGGAHGPRFWTALLGDLLITSIQLRFDSFNHRTVPSMHQRNRRFGGWFDSTRLAARGVGHSPGFTTAVVLTLALGIGANATMFRILDRLLLSPSAYITKADEVRRVFIYGKIFGEVGYQEALTYPDYRMLGEVKGFSQVAAYNGSEMILGHGSNSERVRAEYATASYFPLLGVRPLIGRFYTQEEDRIGAAQPTVVMSHNFWQRRFAGDRGVLGKTLDLGKGRYTVIGVAPKGFTGINIAPVDLWVPLHTTQAIENGDEWVDGGGYYWLSAVARLRAGVIDEQAAAEATTRYRSIKAKDREAPNADQNARMALGPAIASRGPNPSDVSAVAKALGGVAVLVLLIACANVANLFLARGIQRRKQYAVQSALGGSRGWLIKQMVMEAAVLAILAGLAAYALSGWLAPLLFRVMLDLELPRTLDVRVPFFTFAVTLATALLGGLAPALRASKIDALEALRSGRSSLRSYALRRTLLALQAALCVILLIGAGLFLGSIRAANQLNFGLDTDVISMTFELEGGGDYFDSTPAVVYPVLERLRAHPAVEYVAATNLAPFSGMWGLYVDIPGPDSVPRGALGAMYYSATADYFRVLGIPLLRGRMLTDADDRVGAAPVAVVNETMAKTVWRDREALGQCLLIGQPKTNPPCTTVVGVVGNTRPSVQKAEPRLAYYLTPHHPRVTTVIAHSLLIRVKGDPAIVLPDIQAVARSAAPGIRFVNATPLSELLLDETRSWRLGAILLSAFGLLALLVAAGGIYSVLAFDVAQRRYELGVRAALGAAPTRLIGSIVGRELMTASAGIAAGLIGSLAIARAVRSMFFQVEPTDPRVYASVMAIMLGVAALAALVPAWRATRVDPRTAFQAE